MYNRYRSFWADYRAVSNYYKEFTRNIPWMGNPDIARAWSIYNQARLQQYGILVMGRTCVDENGRTPAQFGNAITIEDHVGLGVITHTGEANQATQGTIQGIPAIPVAQGGMIMHFYANANAPWRQGLSGYHFLYNDAWLLGGAHGHHDFNLASPRRLSNLWDAAGRRLTATGREVVFLDSCGYRIRRAGQYEVFTSTRDQDASKASFQSLVAAMKAVKPDGSSIKQLTY